MCICIYTHLTVISFHLRILNDKSCENKITTVIQIIQNMSFKYFRTQLGFDCWLLHHIIRDSSSLWETQVHVQSWSLFIPFCLGNPAGTPMIDKRASKWIPKIKKKTVNISVHTWYTSNFFWYVHPMFLYQNSREIWWVIRRKVFCHRGWPPFIPWNLTMVQTKDGSIQLASHIWSIPIKNTYQTYIHYIPFQSIPLHSINPFPLLLNPPKY